MKSIDLGMSYDNPGPVSTDSSKQHYPSFHYEGDESLDLPHEGTMTIRFKKPSSSVSERDGKKHYSCTVEVLSIEDVDAEEDESPTRKHNDSEEALDSLMSERMKGKKKKGY